VAGLKKVTLATADWDIMNYLPFSCDLVPGDFHLLVPMKVHTEGQQFQNGGELECIVMNRLCKWDETDISSL
jgi:hypothetical protein